jgi:hypothetical protein
VDVGQLSVAGGSAGGIGSHGSWPPWSCREG